MAFTNTKNNMKGKLFGGCQIASDHGILITVGNKFKVLICEAGILTALQKYINADGPGLLGPFLQKDSQRC